MILILQRNSCRSSYMLVTSLCLFLPFLKFWPVQITYNSVLDLIFSESGLTSFLVFLLDIAGDKCFSMRVESEMFTLHFRRSSTYTFSWKEAVIRSALALKFLISETNGTSFTF